ncbi:ATP-dependent DNA ligase [Allosaccharopolyspora coralli]|uniref:DNA ligase (ATP) n=2 Tax=Allosaccharopolyspora coralli TaxID=2665642 RepID=A0A5Q3QCA9_9PSEU|nr:ATP-dependent DNA ligase [Allosaccharopolyspora coralli]
MLATDSDSRPFQADDVPPHDARTWLFERKLDGMRLVAGADGAGTELWSRSGRRVDAAYPEISEAFSGLPGFVVDGEVVAFDGLRTSFGALQGRMHLSDARAARNSGITIHYYLFDLIAVGGVDLRRLPLRTRKRLLQEFVPFAEPLRYTEHAAGHGRRLYEQAAVDGWEGLVAKRSASPYRSGRSRDWVKLPCVLTQEFVVAGFTAPKGARSGFGALLLGYYEPEGVRLRYAGKVGTGFDEAGLRAITARLVALERPSSPLADPVPERGVRWVEPELVAEVVFSEWTGDGRLRQPRYRGLRADKHPQEIVRE